MRKWVHFVAQGFGAGLIPFAPGTMGTLVAIPLYFLLKTYCSPLGYAIFVCLALFAGIWIAHKTSQDLGQPDPKSVVWDEMVGFWITLWFLPSNIFIVITGFLLFRLFDIAKPWPVSWADRRLPGGWGIMLDDVFAGIYAGLILFGIVHVLCYNHGLSCERFL